MNPRYIFWSLVAVALVVAAFSFPAYACSGQMVKASWYGPESGGRTANDERFNPDGLTAAHRTLAFGTKLRISYRGKSVVVRVNDRGPYAKGRQLDLSRGAARAIGVIPAGIGTVCMERVR